MRIPTCSLALLLLIGLRPAISAAQPLRVRLDAAQLRVAAPDFHFITGEALRQLRNGASVTYVFLARISEERNVNVLGETNYRFVISYDLWEEKFAVARLDPSPRSVSHLTSAGAESWCLDSIAIPVDKIGSTQPFWVTVEYRIVENQQSDNASEDSRFTLAGLIDIFSRKAQKKDAGGKRDGGPFRLADLRQAPGRSPERR